MRYCKHCGQEAADDAKFCKHCGQPLGELNETDTLAGGQDSAMETPEPKENEAAIHHAAATSEPTEPAGNERNGNLETGKKENAFTKLPAKTKRLIYIGAAVLLLLIIGYRVVASMNSPEKTAEKFEQAVEDGNTKELEKLLFTKNVDLEINKDSISNFVEYLNENEDEKSNIISSLKRQAEDYEQFGDRAKEFSSHELLELSKDGKTGMFGGYKVLVKPVYFEVKTNYKGTVIYANEEKIATANKDDFEKKVGPFMPGGYAFKAVYKTDVVELENEKEAGSLMPNYASGVYLNINGSSATFTVPFKKGVSSLDLYLNGKKTNVNLLHENKVEPIVTDGSIKASYEAAFPWGKMRSQERPVESSYNDIPFIVDEKLQQELEKQVVQIEKEQIEVITSYGAKKPKTMDPKLADEMAEAAKELKASERQYQIKYLGTDFDKDSFTLGRGVNDWEIEVKAKSYYDQAEYFKGDKAPRLKKKDNTSSYVFTYDQKAKKWQLTSVDYGYIQDEKNVVEYREKNPKLYKTK